MQVACYGYGYKEIYAINNCFVNAIDFALELGGPHLMLAITYIYLDSIEEAHASTAKALELSPYLSVSFILKTSKFKNQAHTQYLIDAMRKAGFPE